VQPTAIFCLMGKARTSSNTRVTPLLPQINTGFTDRPSNPSHIRVFDVDIENGKLSNGKVFEEMPKPSITDGMRADTDGRIWCSVGWGNPKRRSLIFPGWRTDRQGP
jgi:hypothetical protein